VIVASGRDRASDLAALARIPASARRVWIIISHERLDTWARLASRLGHLAAPAGDPCQPFSHATRVRFGVSPRQCPLLLTLDPADQTAADGL